MDIKSLLTKRNIIIGACSLALVIALSLTLVFCTKPEDKPDEPDQGDVTPGGDETPSNPEPPSDPETPSDPPAHQHDFVDGVCECGESDPNYQPSGPKKPDPITYEEYLAYSYADQAEYYSQFEDPSDFFAWYNAAKAEHESANKTPELGENGELDVGDIFGD